MKIIIAGGRDFNEYELLKSSCDLLFRSYEDVEIVSGTARGADSLGERYANEIGYPIKRFSADWDKFKKAAGYIRNEQMAEYADCLVAFYDGRSKGTTHMLNIAQKHNLIIHIINY